MRSVLKREEVSQLEGWGILLFLFLFEFASYLFVSFTREIIFPSLSMGFLVLATKILVYISTLTFCISRFGKINLLELVPDRKGLVILIVALVAEFWVFGLFVGPEGIHNDRYEAIKNLSTFQYYGAILTIVVFVPFLEESLFRRYFLEIQCQHYSTGVAVLITALAGTVFHLNLEFSWAPMVWHFCQELFFCVVYLNSRLGVAGMVHVFVNMLVLLLAK
jgi:membrane protease YdiL (CAAX protease family)